jgi:hypothetical protein
VARVKFVDRGGRVVGVAAALVAALVATGCGELNDYAATERTTAGSVNADAGPLTLRNLRVELDGDGRAGLAAPVLRGSFVNGGDRDDELLRVTSPAAETVRLSGTDAERSRTVPLVAGRIARLEHPTDLGWALHPAGDDLHAGTSIPVTFHFAHQGRVTVTVPVTAE